jgi:hypothetical protein
LRISSSSFQKQAGDDHRQRPRGVQSAGQAVAAGHQGQRDQDLHHEVVHALQKEVPGVAEREAQEDPSHDLHGKQIRHPADGDVVASGDPPQEQEEDHDADTVVEQRLTGDDRLEALRGPRPLEKSEDRDGIRGGDQRAEQQRVEVRNLEPDHPQHQPGRGSDEGGGDRDPHRGQ